jgi:hypothetical protein
VDTAADLGIAPAKGQVRRRVRRGAQFALEHAAVLQRNGDEVLHEQLVARDAARLDDQDGGFALYAACIAERQGH